MNPWLNGVLGVAVIVALLVVWVILTAGRLARLREEARSAVEAIDVQFARRHDLIPHLLAVVRQFAPGEQETFDQVQLARDVARLVRQDAIQDQAAAEEQLTRSLERLLAVAATYPDLVAGRSFRELQDELTATEQRIAAAREYLNGAARTYNTALRSAPASLVAALGRFRPHPYFEVVPMQRASVDVRSGARVTTESG